MEMATDHYSIGYVISGDRRTITPNATYSYHAGDVAMSPPYVYHRTVAESGEPYERILIKYTPDFVKPFIEKVGRKTFDDLYESRVCHFTKEAQEKIFGENALTVDEAKRIYNFMIKQKRFDEIECRWYGGFQWHYYDSKKWYTVNPDALYDDGTKR